MPRYRDWEVYGKFIITIDARDEQHVKELLVANLWEHLILEVEDMFPVSDEFDD